MIDNLQISQSKETPFFPGLSFDALTGVCEIYGESYMEDTFKFYSPVFGWLKRYTTEVHKPMTFNIKLTYFNTSSSRALLDIFDILKKYKEENGSVVINWYYDPDDPDMKYEVEDFRIESGMEINLIEMT
jgi:hypothetical protein